MSMSKRKCIARKCLKTFSNLLLKEVSEVLSEEQNNGRREWVRCWLSRRDIHGGSALLLRELKTDVTQEYKLCLRMTPANFETLLDLVTSKIKRCDTTMRDSITPRVKLEVTLNFLATGNSYRSLSHIFRVSKPAISNFIPEVCDAIFHSLRNFIKILNMQEGSKGFEEKWNFPKCCGAIDGKHILIRAPPNSESDYYNYKGSNSVVLMAVVDHNYCFSYINVDAKGSNSDGGVFQNCSIWDALENGLLPDGYFLVGDDAFPLKTYLMKPYDAYKRCLTDAEQIFNYRLSHARRTVENAFGILISRFRVLDTKLSVKLTTVNKLVCAACAIHNWLRITSSATYFSQGSVDQDNINTGEIIPGQWRAEIAELHDLERYGGRRTTKLAKKMRDHLKDYFTNEGAVPWQHKRIF